MSWLDKLLGRGKQAAGDVTGDSSLRSEGVHQEQEGAAAHLGRHAARRRIGRSGKMMRRRLARQHKQMNRHAGEEMDRGINQQRAAPAHRDVERAR